MMQLDKITISNVRRFKENVEISVGKGATVFLAPNGTGKTAIFEAIELALTGRVRRLFYPPDALIRDSQSKSFIRLDFDSGKYCEADFTKGKEPVLSGDHRELFNSIPKQDIPYLLRLTHLLNQRGDDWFVQSQGTDAAGQLDHLSIGRDAVVANNLMTAGKRAATATVDEANRKFEECQKKLNSWSDLINQRTANSSDLQKSLTSLQELLKQLNDLGATLKIQGIKSDELAAIKGHHNVILSDIVREKNSVEKEIVEVENLGLTIKDYSSQELALNKAKEYLDKSKDSKREVARTLADLQDQFLLKTKDIQNNEDLLISYKAFKEKKQWFEKITREIDDLESQKKKTTVDIEQLLKDMANLNARYDEAKRITELQKEFRNRNIALAEDRSKVLASGKLIDLWRNTIDQLTILLPQLPELEKNFSYASNAMDEKQRIKDQSDVVLQQLQNSFDALNSTSDYIKESIGSIATYLPATITECPVCLHEYPEGELQNRIKKALSNINPILRQAADQLELEKRRNNTLVTELHSAIRNSTATREKVEDLKRNIGTLNRTIDEHFAFRIYESQTLDQALKRHQEATKLIKSLEEEIKIDGEKMKSEKTPEPLQSLEERLEELTSDESKLKNASLELEGQLFDKYEEKKIAENALSELGTIKDLNSNITTQESLINTLKQDLESLRKSQENQERILSQINHILSKDEDIYNQLSIKINQDRIRWSNQGLDDSPSQKTLELRKKQLQDAVLKFDNQLDQLKVISNQIIKWQTFEDLYKIESNIKERRGLLSEKEYEAQLTEDYEAANSRILFLQTRVSTLTKLSKNLIEQLDNVNSRITSINPLWGKLLRRIVLDPRFAGTTLSSYMHYKKQHADVKVKLHGEEYLASQIASEAQITDLQFTFLLAMAQKYQWSPWRALLLDDPTQHHDLVHASSVFDLLRDYVIDQNFQILLATHDSIQANFFIRKLENDGIPTRLCRLKVTAEGVTAEMT